jgi:hypothetical protein
MKTAVFYLSLILTSAFIFTACTSGPDLVAPTAPQDLTADDVEQEITTIEAELDTLDDATDFPDLSTDDFTE